MKPSYIKYIYESLKNFLKEKEENYQVFLIDDSIKMNAYKNRLATGKIEYPCLTVMSDMSSIRYITNDVEKSYTLYDYENHETIIEYDYANTLPVELLLDIGIYSTDIQQLAKLENLILSFYEAGDYISVSLPDCPDKQFRFKVCCSDKDKVLRKQGELGEYHIYESIILLKSDICVSFLEEYSPAQLELDPTSKQDIVARLAALEHIKKFWLDNGENNEEKINKIDQIWGKLDILINDPHEGISYSDIWNEVKNNKYCPVTEAITNIINGREEKRKAQEEEERRIQKEKEKQEAKERRRKKMFEHNAKTIMHRILPQGTDDCLINSYTDYIANDFREALKQFTDVQIYGGSSYMDWIKSYDERNEKTVNTPAVLISAELNYVFGVKEYNNLSSKGNLIVHKYSTNAFPIEFGIRVDIIAPKEDEVNKIETHLREMYGNESVDIFVPDPNYTEEQIIIKVLLKDKTGKNVFDGWLKNTCRTLFYSSRFPTVYYIKNYDKETVKHSHALQLRLLQQAQFSLLCNDRINRKELWKLDHDYKKLITKKFSLFDAFQSKEFKELKSCFDFNRPINRDLFNKVLNDIVEYYPNLYDKMMSGMSYDQIREDLKGYENFFESRWIFLCDILCLPNDVGVDTSCISESSNPRSNGGLSYCIEYMSNKDNSTLSEAIQNYKNFLENKVETYKREEELRRQYREEQSYSSGGGSFVGNVLSTAGGVALGNKISGNTGKNRGTGSRSGKRDLMGSGSCPYGKKDEHGWTIHCGMQCPIHRYCSRG